MIKYKEETDSIQTTLDLTGPDGNAMVLLAHAKMWAEQLGWNYVPIIKEMKSGDYENLVSTLEKHFGDFVTLIR